MAGTITTSGSALVRAGANVYATFTTEIDQFIEAAEAFLCNLVKYDIVTNWDKLDAVYKLLFTEYAERMAAIDAITYQMAGYTKRAEAEDMINVHWARMKVIEELLKNSSVQDFQGV